MNLNYTKLGSLLLRINAIIMFVQIIPAVAMAIPGLSHTKEWAEMGIPNYALSIIVQPLIAVFLFKYSGQISKKAVGHLDENNGA